MNRKPKTLAQLLTRSVARSVLITGLAGAGLVVAQAQTVAPSTGDDVMSIRESAPNSPTGMVERFGCWSGNPPADMVGSIPGHVIIREAGTDKVRHGGSKWVGIALEQMFEDSGTTHEVFAFCR